MWLAVSYNAFDIKNTYRKKQSKLGSHSTVSPCEKSVDTNWLKKEGVIGIYRHGRLFFSLHHNYQTY